MLKLKSLIFYKILLFSLISIACSAQEHIEKVQTIDSTNFSNNHKNYRNGSEENLEVLPFEIVDQVPVYPGCEFLTTNEEQKKCMMDNVQNHFMFNFNTDVGNKKVNGLIKSIIQFTIDKEGNITNLTANGSIEKINKEAIRVGKTLPKMTPGEHNGKLVDVLYTLPITFMVDRK